LTVEKGTLISFNDILAIEHECPHFHVRHTIPVENMDRLLMFCPNCNEPLIRQVAVNEPDDVVMRAFVHSLKEMQRREFSANLRLQITGVDEA
jgi:hypothetical protein